MARSWWWYWRNKGHITKERINRYRSIDSSVLYDNRKCDFREGEENFDHGYCIKCFSNHAIVMESLFEGDLRYNIPVVTTACNYGGVRHWFLCPLPKCSRRSKKLYLCSQKVFVCRKCLNVAYSTQNRSRLDRIIDKKWDLIRKLGGDSDFVQKPPGMHNKTFTRIREEIWRLNELAERGIAEQFGNS